MELFPTGICPAQNAVADASACWHRSDPAGQEPSDPRDTHTEPAANMQGPLPTLHVVQSRTAGVVVAVIVVVCAAIAVGAGRVV